MAGMKVVYLVVVTVVYLVVVLVAYLVASWDHWRVENLAASMAAGKADKRVFELVEK